MTRESYRPKRAGLNPRHMMIGFGTWWALMAIGCPITVLRIENTHDGIFESGINTVKKLANHIRVELLEKNLPADQSTYY